MRRVSLRTVAATLAIFASGGCFPKSAGTPAAVSPAAIAHASSQWPQADAAHLAKGRDVMAASCNRCHGYPSPAAYDTQEWTRITKRMAKKAKLSAVEEESLLHYLVASSEVSRPSTQSK